MTSERESGPMGLSRRRGPYRIFSEILVYSVLRFETGVEGGVVRRDTWGR